MSADNGIYILETSDGIGGFEYRVAHAQAIEDINWNEKEEKTISGYLSPEDVNSVFGSSNVYTKEDAFVKASEIYDKIMDDDFCPIVEYGIQMLCYKHYILSSVITLHLKIDPTRDPLR